MTTRSRVRFLAIVLLLGFHVQALAGRVYSTATSGDSIPGLWGSVVGIDSEGSDGTKGGGQTNEPRRLLGLQDAIVIGLAVDVQADEIYWTDLEFDPQTHDWVPLIRRASPYACETLHRGVPGITQYRYLALDVEGNKLYWTEQEAFGNVGRLRRSNPDGSGTETLVDGLARPDRLRLDVAGGKIYWIELDLDGRIARANLDGTNVETVIEGGEPQVLAVDPVAGKLYWNTGQEPYMLRRADLDGSNPEELFELAPHPIDVDPQGEKVYWAIPTYFPFGPSGGLKRANFDGTNVEIVSALGQVGGEVLFSPVGVLIGPYPCGSIAVPAIGWVSGVALVGVLLFGSAIFVRRRRTA
jgi:hypothetical protein